MSVHQLKIRTEWYDRVRSGDKVAEVRKHDRDYQVGDRIEFLEIGGDGNRTCRDIIEGLITHVLPMHQVPRFLGGHDYVVLSLCLADKHSKCGHSVREAR